MPAGREPSVATFLFTDIVDSTKLHDALGDEAAQEIVRVHNALMRVEISRFGGSELKTMGDGFMIAFRSVTSALGCAVAVQRTISQHNLEHPERPFMVRMGLNAGEAIEEEDDFFGTAVIIAARVAALAGGGEVLTTAAVKQLAEGMRGIEYEDMGDIQLKGLSQPYRVYRVLSGPAEAPARATLRRPEFVGREEELAELRGALQQVASGRNGLCLLIIGEPGVGKTRLAEEAARHARSNGYRVWRGRCYSTDAGLGYMPFVEMLREYIEDRPEDVLQDELEDDAAEIARLVPDLKRKLVLGDGRTSLPPEQDRFRLLEAVRRLVERLARRRPLMLVVEDVQWADSATAILLRHLAPTVAAGRICVVGTCHDERFSPPHPVADVLGEFGRLQAYRRLPLQGLRAGDVRHLLRSLGLGEPPEALVGMVHRNTEGNPFFVTELVNQLGGEGKLFGPDGGWRRDFSEEKWDIPESVRVVIQRRLTTLTEDARRLLSVACVAYKDFTFELLEAVSDSSSDALLDALDDVMRLGIVDETERAGARYRFGHDLTRQTIYEELSSARRQRYHLRLGEALEQASSAEPEALAYHFLNSGAAVPQEKTRHYLVLAGDKAATSAAWEEAARYYESAVSMAKELAPSERAELLRKLGEARSGAGEWEGAVASLSESISLFEELGELESAGWIAFFLRRLYGARGQFENASAIVQRALAFLEDSDSEIRSRLLAQSGFFTGAFGNTEEADRLLGESMQMAERLDQPAAIGYVHYTRGIHHLGYSELSESVEALGKGAEWSLKGSDLWVASLCSSFRRRMLLTLGEVALAEESMDDEEKLARRAGNFLAVCETKWLSSIIASLRGQLERAQDLAEELIRLIEAARADSGLPGALINLAYVRFLRGGDDYEPVLVRAVGAYERMAAAPTDDPRPVLLYLRCLAGETEAAATMMPEMDRYFDLDQPWTAGLGEARLTLASALAVMGDRERVSVLYGPLKEWTVKSKYVLTGVASIPQLVSRVLGMAGGACGEKDETAEQFQAAIQQAREMEIPTEQAETCYWYARHLSPSDGDRAHELFAEAQRIWDEKGMSGRSEHFRTHAG